MPVKPDFDLKKHLRDRARMVDRALGKYLPPARSKPATLHEAMLYSLFAGGKRIRPILTLAASEACNGRISRAIPLACAVECIHAYSLIHDDLPAMDDDDFRRGKPTNHKVYGEAIAILAGDALLTKAFEIAAQAKPSARYSQAKLVSELADTAGSLNLIAGQVADVEGEGQPLNLRQLKYIHERKTSALLTCSVRLGAMSANATTRQLDALTEFGKNVGLAFQVIDDILDVTQSTEKLGKTAGKDAAVNKATYPAVVGLDQSRRIATRLTGKAFAALKPLGQRTANLKALAAHLLDREY